MEVDIFGNPIIGDGDNVYVNKTTSNKKQKDLSEQRETEFVLEVVCNDEKHQQVMYNELTERGFVVRVLTL